MVKYSVNYPAQMRAFWMGLATKPLTEEEIKGVLKLRHDVFCEELNFEEVKSSGIETDDYDKFSTHCYVRHKRTGLFAGALRVISPEANQGRMALERFGNLITHEQLDPKLFDRESIGEVSRAVVPEKFRKRGKVAEESMGDNIIEFSNAESASFSLIAISLYLSAMSMMQKDKRNHAFILMEPRLARAIQIMGIPSEKISENMEFRGIRAAYHVDVDNLKNTLSAEMLKFVSLIERGFKLDRSADKAFAPVDIAV